MADTKYGHLVKKLKYEESNGEYMTMPTGADLAGINLSFAWGYRRQTGIWGGDGGVGHAHPYGECLLFTGLYYDNPNYLGAEIEIVMGGNGEKHVIDSPTVVVLPAGYPHCPLTTMKVERPFGFMAISLSGEHKMTETSSGSITGMNSDNLVKKLDLHDTKRTKGGNADFIAGWNGEDFEGFDLNFTWAFHKGTGAWHENDPHVHHFDEILIFAGTDPDRPDYLGVEIEIQMGDGADKEIHVFDTPTVVIAPKELVHCPLVTKRVDRPYCFSAICLSTGHETIWLGGNKKSKWSR